MTKNKLASKAKSMKNLILRESLDGLKTGDHVFCLRLPLKYQWQLQAMDSSQRTPVMRKAIMDYLDSTQSQD